MRQEFPDDDTCLQILFDSRYGNMKACPKCGVIRPKYYRIKSRMAYECKECRNQIYPLVGTIYQKTTTPLTDWFHALYLFSISKNGIAAKELERQVGVSYKTAHRMCKQIRRLMQDGGKLGDLGTPIEVDEAFIGGKRKQTAQRDAKTPIMAALEVGGHVKTAVISRADARNAIPFLEANVYEGSQLHTDESRIYKHRHIEETYLHSSVNHFYKEFVRGNVTTNHVENFFGQFKRSWDGTYHGAVWPRYLSSYVSEFAYRYSHRNETIFRLLVAKAAQKV